MDQNNSLWLWLLVSPLILLRCFVMLPLRKTLARLVNISSLLSNLWLPSCTSQILSLPEQEFLRDPDPLSYHSCLCVSNYLSFPLSQFASGVHFMEFYADNRIIHFSFSCTETATVLRNLYMFNKPLLPNWLQTTRHAISHLFILEKAEDLTIHIL